ncbi:nucleoplasmin-like protein NO29 isoform X2 [Drosophila willistoni]|uniref:nucleoplasmin-like protein NO29 isoform X2 n=1 Tax=Drosophila willistoni TaxID=7260 RepID=UPI001F078610|nr:nucleoplasmin-like protein NO29 isoform X2 [Drosophila willistoni]
MIRLKKYTMDFHVRVRSGQPFLLRPYDNKKTEYPLKTVIGKAAKIVFYVNGEDAVVKLYGVLYAVGSYDYSTTNVQYHLDKCDSYMKSFTDSTDDDDDYDDDDDDDDDDEDV